MPPTSVDDVADGRDGEIRDRAEVRRARARKRFLWERLLEEDFLSSTPADDKNGGHPPGPTESVSFDGATPGGDFVADAAAAASRGPSALSATAAGALDQGSVRRGMIRFVYLILDMTDAAKQLDYKPRRHEFAVAQAKLFAKQFLTENPLSEVGLAVLRSGSSEVVVPLGSNLEELGEQLDGASAEGPGGRTSVSSALHRAVAGLSGTPTYGTREVLFLFASLGTADPPEHPIDHMAEVLVEKRIRVSVVSMSPELHVLKQVCAVTGGAYSVALDPGHFREVLHGHLAAPGCPGQAMVPKLVPMGFPKQLIEAAIPAACACHGKPQVRLYTCPQCESRVCRVPSRCPVCDLALSSAPTIARSFRQLLPPPPFGQRDPTADPSKATTDEMCNGCQLQGAMHASCPECGCSFCKACDDFVHKGLQQCPGCLEAPPDAGAGGKRQKVAG